MTMPEDVTTEWSEIVDAAIRVADERDVALSALREVMATLRFAMAAMTVMQETNARLNAENADLLARLTRYQED